MYIPVEKKNPAKKKLRPADEDIWFDAAKWFASMDADNAIDNFLKRLGTLHSADRVWIAKANESRTHAGVIREWCRKGIDSSLANQASLSLQPYQWMSKRLSRDREIQFNTDDLPKCRQKLWKLLTAQNVQSFCCFGFIYENKEPVYALGYHYVRKPGRLKSQQRKEARKATELLQAWITSKITQPANDGAANASAIFIKEGTALTALPSDKVVSIDGAANYSLVNITDRPKILQHRSLEEWEAVLPVKFMRIHRSHIINTEMIEKLDRNGGAWKITMTNKTKLPVGRCHRARLLEVLGGLKPK